VEAGADALELLEPPEMLELPAPAHAAKHRHTLRHKASTRITFVFFIYNYLPFVVGYS